MYQHVDLGLEDFEYDSRYLDLEEFSLENNQEDFQILTGSDKKYVDSSKIIKRFDLSFTPDQKIKPVLDNLFKDIEFNEKLVKKLVKVNVDTITANQNVRDLMGGKLSGCYDVRYTQINKDWFYKDMFGFEYDDAVAAIKEIKSIPSNFLIARDDINLITFYIAHRFANSSMSKQQQELGIKEAFNYFGYRTLILLNAHYWKFPITRSEAVSVSEVLSKNYLITRLKNWNEYVHYRTQQYMEGKYMSLVKSFTKDNEIPNAITYLYNGYKDTIKNIYAEYMHLEDTNYIRTSKNMVNDIEGREVLLDRINDSSKFVDKVNDSLVSKDTFVKREVMEVACSEIVSISMEQLRETLEMVVDYYYVSPKNSNQITDFFEDFITNSIQYLQEKKVFLNKGSSVIEVVSSVVGNILYARGDDVSITLVKKKGEDLLKEIYKKNNYNISNRNLTSMRNIFCIYILVLSLV